jgi:hypothetical protein
VSVLQQPAVRAQYFRHFIGAHADFSELELDDQDPRHAMVERHDRRKLRPLILFLDAQGKEVARHTGKLASAEDALLLDRFVNERHYLKTDFATFRATGRP